MQRRIMLQLRLAALFAIAPVLYAQPVPMWKQPLSGNIISEIYTQNGFVTSVVDGGNVISLGLNGDIFWNYKIRGRFLPVITRSSQGTTYVCRSNGDFIALTRSGAARWQLKLGEPVVAPAVCGWDERIFIFLKNKVICLTAAGHRLWQRPLSSPPDSDPQLDSEGGVILVLQNNTILILSPFGEEKTIKLVEKPAFLLPVKPDNSGGRILVIYGDGRLELYTQSGAQNGKIIHLGKPPLAAAAYSGQAAVQLVSGELILLDVEKAQILWRTASNPGVGAAGNRNQKIKLRIDGADKMIYVMSISTVAGFSLVSGEENWRFMPENSVVTPSVGEGLVFFGSRDWIFYAYDAEGRPMRAAANSIRANIPAAGAYGLGRMPSFVEWSRVKEVFEGRFEDFLAETAIEIKSGNLGSNEPARVQILLGILSDTKVIQTERIEAARLLGLAGSVETTPVLVRRLSSELESSVQAEIAIAIGRIGPDPQGRVMAVFSRIIESSRYSRGVVDDALLTAVSAALGGIIRSSSSEISESAVRLLVALTEPGNSAAVQNEARRELDKLSK